MDAVGLYLVLAERLPWTDALEVAERWGGDRAVAFTRDGQPCVRMRYAGRHGVDDAVAIGDAFRGWAAQGRADAEVTQDGNLATVTVCDSTDGVAAAPAPPAQALVGLSLRNDLVVEELDDDAPLRVAKCTADRLVRIPEVSAYVATVQSLHEQIADQAGAMVRSAIRANHYEATRACASGA
jgi:hypothetical protein